MPTLDITDDHRDRIETLRTELAAAHAGEYASVDTGDTLNYLLDLAEVVDDPDRTADPEAFAPVEDESPAVADRRDHGGTPFDTDHARERLESRNRKHGDPDDADEMDLYAIAASFDVTGRSEMTKAELVDSIIDAAERLAADPFAEVDIDLGSADESVEPAGDVGADSNDGGNTDDSGTESATEGVSTPDDNPEAADDGADAGGSSQLDAMMSLLDTHGDKWREGDGDVRYEVDLPDGSVETARTKDDVRALLFKNY